MKDPVSEFPRPLTHEKLSAMSDQEIEVRNYIQELKKTNLEEAIRLCELQSFKYLEIESGCGGVLELDGITFRSGGNHDLLSLADLYYKANEMDKCWKFLGELQSKRPELIEKIREYQSKVCNKEGRVLDALKFKTMSLLHNHAFSFAVTEEQIHKKLKTLIKKAKLEKRTDNIISLVIDNRTCNNVNGEQAVSEFFKSLV